MLAIAASTAGLRAIVDENVAPALTTALTIVPAQYAEAPRTTRDDRGQLGRHRQTRSSQPTGHSRHISTR
jgi:hypothetical protein